MDAVDTKMNRVCPRLEKLNFGGKALYRNFKNNDEAKLV